jgi:hypothetical protein
MRNSGVSIGYNRVYHFFASTQSIIWDGIGVKEAVTKKLETGFHVSYKSICTFEGTTHEAGQRASVEYFVMPTEKKEDGSQDGKRGQ